MPQQRHVLSTHLLRRRARAARVHYRAQQARARGVGAHAHDGRDACAALDLGLLDDIYVERTVFERAKWRVIGVGR